jgi:pimeloyl-ACP methyl ester carboxylesterase
MPTSEHIYYFASKGGSLTKPPVVLIHGAGGTNLHWPHNIRRLPEYRIFAPDLPGHGKSQGLGQQDIKAYSKEIVNWLNRIDIYRAVFIGHSMGGAIALTLALECPERTLGLGLIATGARLGVNPDLLQKLSVEATFPTAVEQIVAWSHAKSVSQEHLAQLTRHLLENRYTVLHGDYLACNQFNIMDALSNISVPACIICGEDDKMTPPKYSEYLAQKLPNASLHLIPDAGHMVMFEQSSILEKTLEEFLKTVPYDY